MMRHVRHAAIIAMSSILVQSTARGQTAILQGIVVDSAGKPIVRAVVMGGSPFREMQTDAQGRFRLSVAAGRACSIEAFQRGSRARVEFDACPDTAIRVVLKRVQPSGASSAEIRDRCGTRASAPCTDPDEIRFVAINAGQSHSCGIATDGVAFCWGDGRNGQLGNGKREIARYPQRVLGDTRFVSIAAGGAFACALTSDGQVYCWGNERTVPGWPHQAEGPARVRLPEPAASLAAGRRHACAATGEGKAFCWGWNVDGETGVGVAGIDQSIVPHPTPVLTERRFSSLSAGLGFTCGVTTEKGVMCWGSNVDRILGDNAPERCGDVGSVQCSPRPLDISLPERIVQLSAGSGHVCGLSESAAVYCWGANSSGQSGVSGLLTVTTPTKLNLRLDSQVSAVSSGGLQTCVLTTRQVGYCWGADLLSAGRNNIVNDVVEPTPVVRGELLRRITIGQSFACALTTSARLFCWGDTILGALGVR